MEFVGAPSPLETARRCSVVRLRALSFERNGKVAAQGGVRAVPMHVATGSRLEVSPLSELDIVVIDCELVACDTVLKHHCGVDQGRGWRTEPLKNGRLDNDKHFTDTAR